MKIFVIPKGSMQLLDTAVPTIAKIPKDDRNIYNSVFSLIHNHVDEPLKIEYKTSTF